MEDPVKQWPRWYGHQLRINVRDGKDSQLHEEIVMCQWFYFQWFEVEEDEVKPDREATVNGHQWQINPRCERNFGVEEIISGG